MKRRTKNFVIAGLLALLIPLAGFSSCQKAAFHSLAMLAAYEYGYEAAKDNPVDLAKAASRGEELLLALAEGGPQEIINGIAGQIRESALDTPAKRNRAKVLMGFFDMTVSETGVLQVPKNRYGLVLDAIPEFVRGVRESIAFHTKGK